MPADGEWIDGDIRYHATACACCVNSSREVDWTAFAQQRSLTPKQYLVTGSLNAVLPERMRSHVDMMYARMVHSLEQKASVSR